MKAELRIVIGTGTYHYSISNRFHRWLFGKLFFFNIEEGEVNTFKHLPK
jgi:hypothetical protein